MSGRGARMRRSEKRRREREEDSCVGGSCDFTGPSILTNSAMAAHALDMITGFEGRPEKPVIPPVTDYLPEKVRISRRCYQFGKSIGVAVREIDDRPVESGGLYAMTRGDFSFDLSEFVVPKGLKVYTDGVKFAEQFPMAGYEMQRINSEMGTDFVLCGMFHVHPGSVCGVEHSSKDDHEFPKLLNKVAEVTRQRFDSPYLLIQDRIKEEFTEEGKVLRGHDLEDFVREFVFPNDQAFFALLNDFGLKPDLDSFNKSDFFARLLDIMDERTFEPRLVSVAFSFVYDDKLGEPYVEIAYEDKYKLSGQVKYGTVENVPIEIFDDGRHVLTMDEVSDLVQERLVLPPKPRPRIPRRRYAQAGGLVVGPHVWQTRATEPIEEGFYGGGINSLGSGRFWYDQDNRTVPRQPVRRVIRRSSVQDRINSLITPGELNEWYGQDDIGEDTLVDMVMQGGQVVTPSRSCVNDLPWVIQEKLEDQVDKTEDKYTREDVVGMFVMELSSYLMHFRGESCRYSTYVDELLDYLGANYRGVSVAIEASEGVEDVEEFEPYFGLRASVLRVGEIVADHPEVVGEHTFFRQKYQYDAMVRNIVDEIEDLDDDFTMSFMRGFITARSPEEKSDLLERYVGLVHGGYKVLEV